jgi:hypothetical protein
MGMPIFHVKPNHRLPVSLDMPAMWPDLLDPGQTSTFPGGWIDLQEWGDDLKEPGSYTIIGPRAARTNIEIAS